MTSPPMILKIRCSKCSKHLAVGSILRHMKTVHDQAIGKRWPCENCGKILQTEIRLNQHQALHSEQVNENQQYYCDDCPYRTIVKAYLTDHVRLMHKKVGNGMFMCVTGSCSSKPRTYPNLQRLEKHKTCHMNMKCGSCDKVFSAKRNLNRHKKNVHKDDQNDSNNSNHERDDGNANQGSTDPLSQLVEDAEMIVM